MKKKRVFNRDDYIGFRCPREFKSRLEEISRKKLRDVSSVAMELILDGLPRLEREIPMQGSRQQN